MARAFSDGPGQTDTLTYRQNECCRLWAVRRRGSERFSQVPIMIYNAYSLRWRRNRRHSGRLVYGTRMDLRTTPPLIWDERAYVIRGELQAAGWTALISATLDLIHARILGHATLVDRLPTSRRST